LYFKIILTHGLVWDDLTIDEVVNFQPVEIISFLSGKEIPVSIPLCP